MRVGGWMLVAALALLGGCTAADDTPVEQKPSAEAGVPAASAPAWREPADYRFVLTRGRDAAAPAGRYQVLVQGGAVASAQRLDGPDAPPSAGADEDLGPVTGRPGEEIDVPTLGELNTMASTAEEDGNQVTSTFDGADGHPVRVTIGTDQPECFTVSDYRTGT